ncbi:MAG: hypothetical protein HOW73_42755 [Polyangiaceae bacterium]|nr:hypothetical protein [Polyangiaceae bacterium]
MTYRWLLLTCSFALALPLAQGCSDDGTSGGSGGSGASDGGSAASNNNGGGGSTGNFTEDEFTSIKIDPPNATIIVDNGSIPAPTDFQLLGVRADGTEVPIDGTWMFSRPDIATSTNVGAVTATGLLGGKGNLTAQFEDFTAAAEVTVKLVITDDSLMLDPSIKDLFENASVDDPALGLAYPYDKTVFPRGISGPVLQWNGGGPADIYRVHAESETFEFTSYANVPPPSRFSFPVAPQDAWKLLVGSTEGDVVLTVQRYDGAQAYVGKTQTWKVAPANLAGTIYYWEINQGNVVRLKVGNPAPENFLQKPPGVTCVACHSVSANGSTLVAGFHGGYSPWGTFNTQDGSSLYPTDSASGFEAISPDGDFVVYGQSNNTNTMSLSTSSNLTPLASLTPPVGAPTHPAWSTDGTRIAYGVRVDGNWLDFNNSSLYVANVDPLAAMITNQVEIVPNNAGLTTNTYPTWSPDSKWIAFQRSNMARTRGALGEVWLSRDDGSVVMPLTAANGTGALPGVEGQASYQPTFLPVAVGGYFWLVFESERTYGNTLTDANPATRRKQLWVTAVDANPQDGIDPSHPSFWLPGQELGNQNMRGAWSLDPCKPLGADCQAGFECCDGFCVYDQDQMKYVCGESEGCSPDGSACEDASDCCDAGAVCINGFCSDDVPG